MPVDPNQPLSHQGPRVSGCAGGWAAAIGREDAVVGEPPHPVGPAAVGRYPPHLGEPLPRRFDGRRVFPLRDPVTSLTYRAECSWI